MHEIILFLYFDGVIFIPYSHNLLDSKLSTVLSMCQDPNLLNPVHGIIQNVVYHEESPPQYQPSCLQSKANLQSFLKVFKQALSTYHIHLGLLFYCKI